MANSKDRGASDATVGTAAGAREGAERATDTVRKVAGAAQEHTQHAVEAWTRGVQESLTRYQEMLAQMPGFGGNGAEAVGNRSIGREQLVELNTELLTYAQGSLNEAFEASKAVINAANLQEAMQIQIGYAQKAMQQSVERATKVSDFYAKASREGAKTMARGMHDAAERTGAGKGANEPEKVRLAG